MTKTYKNIETKLIHAGEPHPKIEGAVAMPVFQSSTFEYEGTSSYDDLKYIRLNNTPNHTAIHAKLAALENAEAALVTASGMAAISSALLTVLSPGGHVLAQNCLYGGTHNLVTEDLGEFGLSYDFIQPDTLDEWESLVRPNTRAIYVEAMTNPLLQVIDHRKVVEFARTHGLISIIDSTFASPINFRPAEIGYDLVLHSCTKYLNGHSDIVAGAIIGRGSLLRTIAHKINHLGGCLDPHAVFLLNRGLKTLAVRVRYQNQSTLRLAQFLQEHPAVEKVNYAGLETHPDHKIARELFKGYGGVLSFELKGGERAAEQFLKNVTLPVVAPSLGGVESLITRPVQTSHSGLSPEDRQKAGISNGLIRVSVGLEATEDLIEDFSDALKKIREA
ncbi:MAG TPA: aminotransferase class I/II-fold pyridoxal phosphate-dependent enzyme [Acidobacteriota bacterium]|nr:aminotransferase class I/II-fold pyridoxal phosphate-dependent enzyme [Acidobacteriota bacterium]